MSIEITQAVQNLLNKVPEKAHADILRRAWDACCDGSVLPNVDFDPWDGEHEEMRMDIEADMVSEAVEDVVHKGDF